MWLALLASCSRVVCGEQIPITGDTSDPEVVAEIEQALRDFLAWTGEEICLEQIEIAASLPRDALGSYGYRVVKVKREPVWVTHTSIVWHELCHVMDHGGPSRDPAFGDAFEGLPMSASEEEEDDRAAERFAQWCGLGPLDPVFVAAETACGRPGASSIMEQVWREAPARGPAEIRIAAPEHTGVPVAELAPGVVLAADRVLHDPETHEWTLLDEQLHPSLVLQSQGEDELVAYTDDRIWVRHAMGEPIVELSAAGAVPTSLPPLLVGGYGEGHLWLWGPSAPGEILQALPDGTVVARHPLPQGAVHGLRTHAGALALWVSGADFNRLVSLPGGEVLVELPLAMALEGPLLAGELSYSVGLDLVALGPGSWTSQGEIWMGPDGTVYVSPDCASEFEELPGSMQATLPSVLDEKLWAVDTRWPLE